MRRFDLVPDCGSCAALCCIATSFERSAEFAAAKPAGERCQYLTPACRCAIHCELGARGFSGCTLYECYGAGPLVTAAFRDRPADEDERNAAFLALRDVHELLWMLTETAKLCPGDETPLLAELAAETNALDACARETLSGTSLQDFAGRRRDVLSLLRRVGKTAGLRRSRQDRLRPSAARSAT